MSAKGKAIGGVLDGVDALFRRRRVPPRDPVRQPTGDPIPRGTPGTGPDRGPLPPLVPPPGEDGAEPELDRPVGTKEGTSEPEAATAEPECEDCDDCPPRRDGKTAPRTITNSTPPQVLGWDYQHFICPWHAYVPGSSIEEWEYAGVEFDGMHPEQCLLLEAKHGYDDFLVTEDWSASGRPRIDPKKSFAEFIFKRFEVQAGNQRSKVDPHYPRARLEWVFSASQTSVYVGELFLRRGWWDIKVRYTPYP